MVEIKMKKGKTHAFNMLTSDKEHRLQSSWSSISDNPFYASKSLKITMENGDSIVIKVSDIESIRHKDGKLLEGELSVGPYVPRAKPSSETSFENVYRSNFR